MQHEITRAGQLLNANGSLVERGYAKTLLRNYCRQDIKAGKLRIKEWDYYIVANDRCALALTIADNSYMGLYSVSLLDFAQPWYQTTSRMKFFTLGKTGLPASSREGSVCYEDRRTRICFEHAGSVRRLSCHMDGFCDKKPIDAEIILSDFPAESMVIATPFKGAPRAFYYNQKINCMTAKGSAAFDGKTYVFSPTDSMGTLDWGRGVWTYKNTWYWGSASGFVEGARFGFNIGYGFGDTSAASENMLFYNGRAHKLSQVTFHIPMKNGAEDYLAPWTFTSDDGRFEMDFMPILDRRDHTSVGVIASNQHQVFGRFTGKAVLDDGQIIQVRNFLGFAEKVMNRW